MNAKLTVTNVRARPVLVPFRRPPVAASGTMPNCPLLLLDLETFGFSRPRVWATKLKRCSLRAASLL